MFYGHVVFPDVDEPCGPYGHDIRFRSVCAAWRRPPDVMSKEEHRRWRSVQEQVEALRRRKEEEAWLRFRAGSAAMSVNSVDDKDSTGAPVNDVVPKLTSVSLAPRPAASEDFKAVEN
jgi:hypothetical protein